MKKNRMIVILVTIITLLLSITSTTYAYFYFESKNTNIISGDLAEGSLALNVEKIFPLQSSNNTGVIVPQLEIALSNALKAGCVDSNTNVVCQVYHVNLKNTGTATGVFNGTLTLYGDKNTKVNIATTMPNLKWKRITSVNTTSPANSVLGNISSVIANSDISNSDNFFTSSETLNPNQEKDYYLIIWINEINNDQNETGKTYYGKISFESTNGVGITSTFRS